MAIIGRGALLALTMLLAGCAGLDRSGSTAGEYPDDVYGRGGWNTERDPYWRARDPYYSPYGWSGFGPYGYWGYPGWWGPPVYYVYPEVEAARPEPGRPRRLQPLQERMLRIGPVPPLRWTPPGPVPSPSRDRGVFPLDRPDQPRLPPQLKPPPVPSPPVIRSPQMRVPQPEAEPEAPRPRRSWRRPGADRD